MPRFVDLVALEILESLSVIELEIGEALVAGWSNAEIGRLTSIPRTTLARRIAAVLRKIGLTSRAELQALAARHTKL
jgi:DNA-binding NarL/FixJ family response regulator